MPGKTIQIRSGSGGVFDCYLALPETDGKVPAVVLASAVHGVDADVRATRRRICRPRLYRRGARSVLALGTGTAASK